MAPRSSEATARMVRELTEMSERLRALLGQLDTTSTHFTSPTTEEA